jgi:SAM-dependent methyltransferase
MQLTGDYQGMESAAWKSAKEAEVARYHTAQWNEPYRSTIAFTEFARPWLSQSKFVLDLGCGAGAPTSYLAQQFPGTRFVGLDSDRQLFLEAKRLATERRVTNLDFHIDYLENLATRNGVDGIVSIQTLSWLRDVKKPIVEMCKFGAQWLAFSSLFYPGDISCKVEVTEHGGPRTTFYNVFGVPELARAFKTYGYRLAKYERFDIDIDLAKPDNADHMRTYTERLEDGRLLQISGPLLMNWGFVAFERA